MREAFAVAAFSLASSHEGPKGGVFTLAALGTFPLAVRRLYPIPVLACTVAVTAWVGLNYDHPWWPFGVLVALYTVGAHCGRRVSMTAGGVALLVLAVPVVNDIDWGPLGWNDIAQLVGRSAPLAAAGLLGSNLRTRRAYLRAIEDRAAQLEREQDANAQRAAAQEQARIARGARRCRAQPERDHRAGDRGR